jgi:hypothetical protein
MTDEQRQQARAIITRNLQREVLDRVEKQRQKDGSSFQSAWSRLRAADPKSFDILDRVNELSDSALTDILEPEELERITQRPDYTQQYPPYEAPKIPNNVPGNKAGQPLSKGPGENSPDPRAKRFQTCNGLSIRG